MYKYKLWKSALEASSENLLISNRSESYDGLWSETVAGSIRSSVEIYMLTGRRW